MSSIVEVAPLGSPFLARDGARFARVERHLILGTIALIATVVLIDHVASPAGYASFVIAVGFTVRSFARAVDAGFGKFYGWVYGEPTSATFLDRLAFRVIHRRRYGQRIAPRSSRITSYRNSNATTLPDESRVRIVEIDATELLARFEEGPGL